MKKRTIKKVRAIIYDIKNGEFYFLILRRILRWKGWEMLKETLEKKETSFEALKRGIKEETKLKNFEIIKSLDKEEKWTFRGINYSIVDTFLVRADMSQKISLKQEIVEHDKYEWVDRETAIKKLTWPKTKKLLEKLEINGK
ncbi:MAG: NUDIX domain-containing protein [bacterium]|nr:NUDIX domain-containing protein [bacterium]